MEKFLIKSAKHLLAKYGSNMSAVTVLTPNRRSCIFLKQALIDISINDIWLPEIITLQDWVFTKSSLALASPLELTLQLYDVFKEAGGEESLDDFIALAQVMLEDFNEVDIQLADAGPFFRYLENLQSLKVYVPGEEPDEYAIRYRRFWHLFRVSYFAFQQKLLAQNKGYEGLIYRNLAEQLAKSPVETGAKFAAIGFSYLTKSEEKIIQFLRRNYEAEVIWDTDRYYAEDDYQEGGTSFRKYIREWRIDNSKWQEDLIGLEPKQIDIIGVAKNIGQTKVVADILANKLKLDKASEKDTVIVVPDESLLDPLLAAIPGNISTFNISMGYPLRESLPASLLRAMFSMHDGMERFRAKQGGHLRFYYRDVFDLLHHPYANFLKADANAVADFVNNIRIHNRMVVSEKELRKLGEGTLLGKLFWHTANTREYLQNLLDLIETLKSELQTLTQSKQDDRSVDVELLFHIHKQVLNIQNALTGNEHSLSIQTLRKLLSESIRFARVPFEGEPVQGLQIMGTMETRSLDFRNVIILSMNEGVFPSGKKQNSYIPFEMKKEFLSTHKDKDAESAYLFYRLLQRAENVFLIYNTESDELGGGEKSRFILQLQHELKKANAKATINDLIYSVDPPPQLPADDLVIKKDEGIMKLLLSMLTGYGMSPSALNTYINCSLQYYLRYITNLREQDDIEESIEAATLGSAVHDVLEHLHKEKVGEILTQDFVTSLIQDKKGIETATKEALSKRFEKEELTHGKNYLLYRVCVKLVDEFLKHEKNYLHHLNQTGSELKLLMLENAMVQPLKIGGQEIRITGKVDRVEESNGVVSIADYKTGSPVGSSIKSDDVALFATDPKYAKAMQLLMYAWLYWRNNESKDIQLRSGIYWLRQITDGFDALKLDKSDIIDRNILLQFEEVLRTVLAELLNTDIPFSKTTDIDRCRNCEFVKICKRE